MASLLLGDYNDLEVARKASISLYFTSDLGPNRSWKSNLLNAVERGIYNHEAV